jgi:hypothetical protein
MFRASISSGMALTKVCRADQATVNRLTAIGTGIAIHPWRYLSGANLGGVPMRMIVDKVAAVLGRSYTR